MRPKKKNGLLLAAVGLFVLALGVSLQILNVFDSKMLTLLVSLYGFLTLGHVATSFFDNQRKQRRMDKIHAGSSSKAVDLTPVLKTLASLETKLGKQPVGIPDAIISKLNAHSNQAALVSQGLSLLLRKMDHITIKAGWEILTK